MSATDEILSLAGGALDYFKLAGSPQGAEQLRLVVGGFSPTVVATLRAHCDCAIGTQLPQARYDANTRAYFTELFSYLASLDMNTLLAVETAVARMPPVESQLPAWLPTLDSAMRGSSYLDRLYPTAVDLNLTKPQNVFGASVPTWVVLGSSLLVGGLIAAAVFRMRKKGKS